MNSTNTQPRTLYLCLAVMVLALLLFTLWPAIRSWGVTINRLPFSQSGLQWITLIALGIVIGKNFRLPPLQTSIAGLLVFTVAAAVYLLAGVLHIYALYWLGAIALVATSLWAFFGGAVFYRALNLVIFSMFLLPKMPLDLYTGISVPLQMFSTRLTANLAGVLIPVTHSGNVFYINNSAFEVTVACSGLNTWIGFLFAGLLWLAFDTFSIRKLLFVLVSAPLLALLVNTARLLITALVAYHHSPDAAVDIHTNLEYILFPLGLAGMAWLGSRILKREHAHDPA